MSETLRIATRRSQLALWQAKRVAELLVAANPELDVELLPMSTSGDLQQETSLAQYGGKGLFIKELESALLTERADIAVHSMKDVPAQLVDELHISAVIEREDPRDAFVSNKHDNLDALPDNAVIGTSSVRRQCQLRQTRPDVVIELVRGNVNTRLRKLDDGKYDAILLACAGLKRLKLDARIREALAPEIMLPAVCQGTIGVECRRGDSATEALLATINHSRTWTVTQAERAVNHKLAGGCNTPIAVFAELVDASITIRALVGSHDGSKVLRDQLTGSAEQAVALGEQLGDQLLEAGAARLIAGKGENE